MYVRLYGRLYGRAVGDTSRLSGGLRDLDTCVYIYIYTYLNVGFIVDTSMLSDALTRLYGRGRYTYTQQWFMVYAQCTYIYIYIYTYIHIYIYTHTYIYIHIYVYIYISIHAEVQDLW